MLKAIFFDLDETLLDWSGRLGSWEAHEAKHLRRVYEYMTDNVQTLSLDFDEFFNVVMKRVIDEWDKAKKSLLAPHLGYVLMNSLVEVGLPAAALTPEHCLNVYAYEPIEGVKAYPEAHAVLAQLQTYPLQLGLITNAFQTMPMRDVDLAAADLLQFFPHAHFRLSAADVGYLKPHPKIFEELLGRMEIQAHEAVFVGDNLTADIGGAQGVGIKAVWRKSAHHPTEIIPDGMIETLEDLPTVLDDLFPAWREF